MWPTPSAPDAQWTPGALCQRQGCLVAQDPFLLPETLTEASLFSEKSGINPHILGEGVCDMQDHFG